MKERNIEIEIARDGRVKVHVRGVKGEQCLEYVNFLADVVGPVAERRLTQEYYERDGRVRVDAEQVQHVRESNEA
ncbi:MAG: DUF2997 domain-containing protein [Candidatus Brocadiaceae bacterium]|mgnify:CR=1 FL=1|nr:DUF2997 domain-containing protein [Candidatus Brocadiaceae bacterium]